MEADNIKEYHTEEIPNYRNEEWLKQEYQTKNRPIRDIAKEEGISINTIKFWLSKFKIKRLCLICGNEITKKYLWRYCGEACQEIGFKKREKKRIYRKIDNGFQKAVKPFDLSLELYDIAYLLLVNVRDFLLVNVRASSTFESVYACVIYLAYKSQGISISFDYLSKYFQIEYSVYMRKLKLIYPSFLDLGFTFQFNMNKNIEFYGNLLSLPRNVIESAKEKFNILKHKGYQIQGKALIGVIGALFYKVFKEKGYQISQKAISDSVLNISEVTIRNRLKEFENVYITYEG